jgi:hypothetical protein
MHQSGRVKSNVRVLVFIVSLPFWALLVVQIYSLWLGDPYSFDFMHIVAVAAVYLFFRIVVLGRNPIGRIRDSQQ